MPDQKSTHASGRPHGSLLGMIRKGEQGTEKQKGKREIIPECWEEVSKDKARHIKNEENIYLDTLSSFLLFIICKTYAGGLGVSSPSEGFPS